MKKETKEWMQIASEDKVIAMEMWQSKRNVYAIMFWQQTWIEKQLK